MERLFVYGDFAVARHKDGSVEVAIIDEKTAVTFTLPAEQAEELAKAILKPLAIQTALDKAQQMASG